LNPRIPADLIPRPRPGEALAGAQQMVGPNDRELLPSSSSATWAAESAVAL
jgi:hypothetical protein